MKTSIFDMSFVLPPMVEMTEVEKDMPIVKMTNWTALNLLDPCGCVKM